MLNDSLMEELVSFLTRLACKVRDCLEYWAVDFIHFSPAHQFMRDETFQQFFHHRKFLKLLICIDSMNQVRLFVIEGGEDDEDANMGHNLT